ncbi:MAG: hypothetical protein CL675_11490 [Bdellovibrionaceae bacterium]|nr:hypothetical protein [Pseudobdellovibrionaceae bacterium]
MNGPERLGKEINMRDLLAFCNNAQLITILTVCSLFFMAPQMVTHRLRTSNSRQKKLLLIRRQPSKRLKMPSDARKKLERLGFALKKRRLRPW